MFKPGDKVKYIGKYTDMLDPEKVYTVKDIIEGDRLTEGFIVIEESDDASISRINLKYFKHADMTEEPLDNNPKTLVALTKPRLSDVPPVGLFALGAAMSDGAKKYGRFNYRDTSVTASVFYDAILRHLTAWYNGEDHAPDSKVHHLGHIMASCAIILDAERHAVFNDDRDKRDPRPNTKSEWMVEE